MCQDCGCEIATDLISRKILGVPQVQQVQKLQISQEVFSEDRNRSTPVSRRIEMGQAIVEKNIQQAELNRMWFRAHQIPVINMMSAPGSGKTYLLEKTVQALADSLDFAILTGDQEMSYDADRLKRVGARVKQINTLSSCHLNAQHIEAELQGFVGERSQLLVIENVGNLVCPAAFDLGESHKVAVLSTTEGEDKPSKYPLLFHEADLIIVSKMDLVPYLDWTQEVCQQHIRKVNPNAPIFYLSAKTGEGMEAWLKYVQTLRSEATSMGSLREVLK